MDTRRTQNVHVVQVMHPSWVVSALVRLFIRMLLRPTSGCHRKWKTKEELMGVLELFIPAVVLRTVVLSFLYGPRVWIFDSILSQIREWSCSDQPTTIHHAADHVTRGCAVDDGGESRDVALSREREDVPRLSLTWAGRQFMHSHGDRLSCSIHGRYLFVRTFSGHNHVHFSVFDKQASHPTLVAHKKIDISASASAADSGRFIVIREGECLFAMWQSLYHGVMLQWPTLICLKEFDIRIGFTGHPSGGHNSYMYDCCWIRADFVIVSYAHEALIAYDLTKRIARGLVVPSNIQTHWPVNARYFILLILNNRTLFLPSEWLIAPHHDDNVYYEFMASSSYPEVRLAGRILSTTPTQLATRAGVQNEYKIVDDRWFVGWTACDIQQSYNYPPLNRCLVAIDFNDGPDLRPRYFSALHFPPDAQLLCAAWVHD